MKTTRSEVWTIEKLSKNYAILSFLNSKGKQRYGILKRNRS